MKLKIAAKIDDADALYVEAEIAPLLALPHVEFLGEVDDAGKAALLADARAVLFPIDWPEPFGLVMIEAMAAGTPVIAWRSGAVPEVIEDGVTGAVVDAIEDAVAAVGRLDQFSRPRIRAVFEARFTARRMSDGYVSVYERMLDRFVSRGRVAAR